MAVVLMVGCVSTLHAAAQPLQLNPLFQDHAVLQRGKPVAVWGEGPAGETLTVSLQAAATAGPATGVPSERHGAAPPTADATPLQGQRTTVSPRSVQTRVSADGHWS